MALLPEFGPNLRGFVRPNEAVEIPNNAALTIWDQTVDNPPGMSFLQYCRIQNIDVQKILVCLNDTATAQKFCKILAVDTAAGAGNGGIIEIPGSWNVTKISVLCPGGVGKAAVTIVTNCTSNRIIN
jgi:hypothetical protein